MKSQMKQTTYFLLLQIKIIFLHQLQKQKNMKNLLLSRKIVYDNFFYSPITAFASWSPPYPASASTGSSLLAFMAGLSPKKIPTKTLKTKEITQAETFIE